MKVTIKLSPFAALSILKLHDELTEDMTDERLSGIKESIEEYKSEILKNMTLEMVDDAFYEREILKALNKEP